MANNKRSITSYFGLVLSFIGMSGLVLSIISLLPINGYNLYIATVTTLELIYFEHERTHQDWKNIPFSNEAKLFLLFLCGSIFSSMLEILVTFFACCRHRTIQTKVSTKPQHYEDGGQTERTALIERKSWFIRFTTFTILTQIVFSLLGGHLIYYLEVDNSIIPMKIQHNAFISFAILGINYLSLISFSFIILFASFFILLGTKKPNSQGINQHDETRPLIIV